MMLLKNVYDKLVAKVNNIDTSRFVLKTNCVTDKSDLGNKISDFDKEILILMDLLKKPDHNAKIKEIRNKIHTISGLAANSALTAAENKIPVVSNLVKKFRL